MASIAFSGSGEGGAVGKDGGMFGSETVERRFGDRFGFDLENLSEKDWRRLSGTWHRRKVGNAYPRPLYLGTAGVGAFCNPLDIRVRDRPMHDDPGTGDQERWGCPVLVGVRGGEKQSGGLGEREKDRRGFK